MISYIKNLFNNLKPSQKIEFGIFIVILFLILIIDFSDKHDRENFQNKENFEGDKTFFDSALNSYNTTNNLVKDIFPNVDSSNATVNKNLTVNGNLKSNNVITNNVSANDTLKSSKVIIGNTTLYETDLKKMMSTRKIAGYAVSGRETTHLLFEGGWYNLYKGAKFDAWSNDSWDVAYVFRGWKLEVAEHGNGKGYIWRKSNTEEDVKKLGWFSRKPSSYKVTWIGY